MTITTYSNHKDLTGRTIPSTTEGACLKYKTTVKSCTCSDHVHREGGSYRCPLRGNLICKHIYRRRVQSIKTARALRAVPRMKYLELA